MDTQTTPSESQGQAGHTILARVHNRQCASPGRDGFHHPLCTLMRIVHANMAGEGDKGRQGWEAEKNRDVVGFSTNDGPGGCHPIRCEDT
jgi:hypothetical protein